jgi:hypothetical protein
MMVPLLQFESVAQDIQKNRARLIQTIGAYPLFFGGKLILYYVPNAKAK